MAAQNGKDLLIKVDLSGAGQFETMAGLRSTRIAFNAETVDVTSLESEGGWRELLGGAGVRLHLFRVVVCLRMTQQTNAPARFSLTAKRRVFR